MIVFVEGLFVLNDIGMGDVGEVEDLVKTVGAILISHRGQFHLLYGVVLSIGISACAIDDRKGSFSYSFEYLKIIHMNW